MKYRVTIPAGRSFVEKLLANLPLQFEVEQIEEDPIIPTPPAKPTGVAESMRDAMLISDSIEKRTFGEWPDPPLYADQVPPKIDPSQLHRKPLPEITVEDLMQIRDQTKLENEIAERLHRQEAEAKHDRILTTLAERVSARMGFNKDYLTATMRTVMNDMITEGLT